MNFKPTINILNDRILNLFNTLNTQGDFDTAIIISKVNQYYFTGTMQDGLLVLTKGGKVFYFVRKSHQRAKLESPLDKILWINSYRDILEYLPSNLGSVYLETEVLPIATLNRIKKYFTIENMLPIDRILFNLRAVKSNFEVEILKESGKQHNYLMNNIIPDILQEGMSEADFMADLYNRMIKLGHHGVSRFAMFQAEMIVGQMGFGDNSLYPTNFDGPGGMLGMSPAVPIIGSRDRYLKKGDLIFVDVSFGVCGYHTDKTQVYSFGGRPSDHVISTHNACLEVQKKTAKLLTEGNIPSEIYSNIMDTLPEELSTNFMGYESVKFLGHGTGLQVDEYPIIAKNFNSPLKENMVVALEPKCAIEGVGTVGVEETYLVTKAGPNCLTGGASEIIIV